MVLVIGGRASGKLTFAKTIMNQECSNIQRGVISFDCPILYGLSDLIKERIENNLEISQDDIMAELLAYKKEQPNGIIICDEVGCGIVPIDGKDRVYREMVGRVLCELGKISNQVYRVYCGIGVKIKDVNNHIDTAR